MNPLEFAAIHLQPYKIRGDEIIPEYCPFCKGGHKHEKYKFALNMSKLTYNCKRLNECGATGPFWKLCKEFGEVADGDRYIPPARPKTYKQPVVKTRPVQSQIERYLTVRGFSKSTWERRQVVEHQGAIAMPYYEEGKLVLMKYRTTSKPSKHWREEGGKPVFWGMDLCDTAKPLVICEGEMDALAMDECGVPNVVSVPSGADDLTCVELCWEWLEKFNKIIIWGDNDKAGKEMVQKLVLKLGHKRCYLVESPHKDANIHLYREGKDAVLQAVEKAKEVPVAGIIKVADIKRLDMAKIQTAYSCLPGINKILGGYRMGELTVWSGTNSSGKSTFLGQEIVESIEQGFPVFAYSGELSQVIFKEWIHQQMAGPQHLEVRRDTVRERDYGHVNQTTAAKLEEWYGDMFYLYDSYSTEEGNLLNLCEIAARRYGCRVFLLDNLMTTGLGGVKADSEYQAQGEFVRLLANFAKKYDVHVHLVAHPRKLHGKMIKADVSGSGAITNRADNVVAIHRFTPAEKEESDFAERYGDSVALIQIFKNRFYGTQDVELGVKFEDISKRFYASADEYGPDKDYGWVRLNGQQSTSDSLAEWETLGKVVTA